MWLFTGCAIADQDLVHLSMRTGWFLACTPYISYVVLQRLGLVPASPIIPGLRVFSRDYLTCLVRFEPLPTEFTLQAAKSWMSTLYQSPLLWLSMSAYMKRSMGKHVVPVIRDSLSRFALHSIFWASTTSTTHKSGNQNEPQAQEKSITHPHIGLGAGLLMRFQTMRQAILQGSRRQEATQNITASSLPSQEETQPNQEAPSTPIASAAAPTSSDDQATAEPSDMRGNDSEAEFTHNSPSFASHESSPMEPPVTGVRLAHHRGDNAGTALLELEVTRPQRPPGRSRSNSNTDPDHLQTHLMDSSYQPAGDPNAKDFTTKLWAVSFRSFRDWMAEDVTALLLLPVKAHFLRTLAASFLAAEGMGNLRAQALSLTSPTLSGVSNLAQWSAEQASPWARNTYSLSLIKRVGETFKIDIWLGVGVLGVGCLGIWWYTSRDSKMEKPEASAEQEQEHQQD